MSGAIPPTGDAEHATGLCLDGMTIYESMTSTSLPSPSYQGGGGGGGGFSAGRPDGMSSEMPAHVLNVNMEEPVKRKRRRPRKDGPDGSTALALTPVPTAAPLLPRSGGFSHSTEAIDIGLSRYYKESKGPAKRFWQEAAAACSG